MTSRTDRESGFTLIEMMVVIAVLGIILGMLAGFGAPGNRRAETRAAAAKVAAAMLNDRGRAISSGQKVTLVLPKLPGWLAVTVTAPAGGIVFAPDGSSSGGRVLLAGGERLAVSADWLTGRVGIGPP